MYRCECCKKDIACDLTTTCVEADIEVDGLVFSPIPYNNSNNHIFRCPDCNVLIGGFHHFGCDQEICPVCFKQLITCKCPLI